MIGAQLLVPPYGDPFMEDVRGRFVWHQLMTRDVPGAKKYYSKIVGWKTMPWPLDPAYTVCHADAGPVAGIMEIPADVNGDMPRTGCSTSARATWMRPRMPRCAPAARSEGAQRHAGRGPLRRAQGSAGRGVRHHRSGERRPEARPAAARHVLVA
jgi:hypothetical protein